MDMCIRLPPVDLLNGPQAEISISSNFNLLIIKQLLTPPRLWMEVPNILLYDVQVSISFTNLRINLNIPQNIEECVCYMPRKEVKLGNIPYFVTGIGDCLNYCAAL